MKKPISRNLFIWLLLSFLWLFQACTTDDGSIPLPEDKYLAGITTERRFTKLEIIEKLHLFSPELELGSTLLALLVSDVDVAAITYHTTGVDGKKVIASGVVAMCADTESYDNLLSIQHYTIDMEEAPSRILFNYEMAPIIKKRVIVMADYLGYGVSQTPTHQHPFLHISSTGTACADMIEAAREYLRKKGIKENSDKVELMGYSQGGTSSIATLLEMERRGTASRVIGVHAGGGVYDLVSMVSQYVETDQPNSLTGYLPFLIRGMEYGEQMTLDPAKIYAPRLLNEGLLAQLDQVPLSVLHTLLGTDISKVVHPDCYAFPSFNGNTEIKKLLAALRKNSLISKSPATAVTLYHSQTDDFIPFANAEAAHAKWKNSTLVKMSSVGHIASGTEFFLRVMGFWEFINK